MKGDRVLKSAEDLFALVEEIGERFVGTAEKL
jgi:hypothetical protein